MSKAYRVILLLQAFWLTVILVLGGWWVHLVRTLATRVSELENQLGVGATSLYGVRIHHMIFWESLTFFALILTFSGFLIWIYWKDALRARSLQAFFASVTHELRTPLTSVRLQAEALAKSMKDSGTQVLVNRLLEDTTRLESQVERTLELARIEGGGKVYLQPLPIKSVIERLLRTDLQFDLQAADIQLQLEALTLEADTGALQVIFRNLIENSKKHAKKSPLQISISSKRVGDRIQVLYQDNGVGFSGDRTQLGRLFFKGPDSRGAGVGLYLIHSLMKKMGGQMIFPNPSKTAGTGFSVCLQFTEVKSHG